MNDRVKYIDIARAFAIILIVFGHTIVHNSNCYWLYKFIYSFHIILFFIISGYVYNEKSTFKDLFRKKMLTLMVPYFVFSFLFLIPYFIFGKGVNDTLSAAGNFNIISLVKEIFMGVGVNGALKQNTSLWFLPALFSTEIIYKIVDNKKLKKTNMLIKLMIFFAISYLFTKCTIIFPWGINTAIVLMPFYYMGTILKQTKVIEKINEKKIIKLIMIILTGIAIYLSMINNTVSCANYVYGNYAYFTYVSCIISIDILAITCYIRENDILEYIGRNTLSIFIFHKLIILIFQTKIKFTANILSEGNTIECIIVACIVSTISITMSLLIGKIINKYFPFLYGRKGKNRMKVFIVKGIRVVLGTLMRIINLFDIKHNKEEINEKELMKEIDYNEKDLYDLRNSVLKEEEIDLSIIIPVYNSEKYLEKCLNAVIEQKTKYKYEIICVNDGSTDSSLDILKRFEEKNIKIISQENKGISGARNTGIENALGKYIAFIDNDDYVTNDYVENLLNVAYKNNADIVKCNFVNFLSNDNNRILNIVRHEDVVIEGKMNEQILDFKGFIWGGIIKKSLFKKVRFPIGYWYEDMIMRIILMRECEKFVYIDDDLYFYNIHQTNASKTLWKSNDIKCFDQYILAKKLLEESNKLGIEDNGEVYLILLEEYGNILWLRTRNMKHKIRKKVFLLACREIEKYQKNEKIKKSFSNMSMSKAFKNRDYVLWNITALYIMLKVKYLKN